MKRLLLRLLSRPTTAPLPKPSACDNAAEAALQRLEWTVLRRLDGQLHGAARTLTRGTGLDLADLREYQVDDDVRRIDWNLSARMGSPHVRVDHEERELCAWFLVDATPSQAFGSSACSKQALAQDCVAALARSFTRAGHRVGAVIHHGGAWPDTVLPARGGRTQVLRLLQALQHLPTPEANPGLTRLDSLLHNTQRLLRTRSAVFLVSDFVSAPGWEPLLGRLATRHEVLALRLLDPMDHQLPPLGLVHLRDSETGEQVLVDCGDSGLQRRYAALAAQRDAELQASFSTAGVDALELSTEEELAQTLLRYASQRQARAQGAQRTAHFSSLRHQAAPHPFSNAQPRELAR